MSDVMQLPAAVLPPMPTIVPVRVVSAADLPPARPRWWAKSCILIFRAGGEAVYDATFSTRDPDKWLMQEWNEVTITFQTPGTRGAKKAALDAILADCNEAQIPWRPESFHGEMVTGRKPTPTPEAESDAALG